MPGKLMSLLMACIALPMAPPATSQPIFANGFEAVRMHNAPLRLGLLALLICTSAIADVPPPFSFIPSRPTDADMVLFRVETPEVCSPTSGGAIVDSVAHTIDVFVSFSDICDPNDPAQNAPFRIFDVGVLPAGDYSVAIRTCSNPPPPLPACSVVATGSLSVLDARATRFTVPALSQGALLLLAGFAAAVGWWAVRRS